MLNTIVITGPPGSGKTIQARLLAEKTGYRLFSPGERYRDIATKDTSLGKRVRETIGAGYLGPYWLSVYLFQDAVFHIEHTDGIIFEGVGRKEEEARVFDETMEWLKREYRVIDISVGEDTIIERLTRRRDIESRDDDDPEDIPVRIKEYEKHTVPATEFFKSVNKYIRIRGEQTVEEVHNDIVQALNR